MDISSMGGCPMMAPGGPVGKAALAGGPNGTSTSPASTPPGSGAVAGASGLGGGGASPALQQVLEALQQLIAQLQGALGGTRAGGPGQLPPGAGAPGQVPDQVPGKGGPGQLPPPGGPPPIAGGGAVAPVGAAPSHTSIHGTVLSATDSAIVLRDDMGVQHTFQVDPKDLAKLDMPHLLEKHVKTGKTLDLTYATVDGKLFAKGYSHPPAVPVPGAAPAPASAVPHGALHGTVVSASATSITVKDDAGTNQTFEIRPQDAATMDLQHLLTKHVPTGKALNLVFTEVDGKKYAVSYNHPDTTPPPAG